MLSIFIVSATGSVDACLDWVFVVTRLVMPLGVLENFCALLNETCFFVAVKFKVFVDFEIDFFMVECWKWGFESSAVIDFVVENFGLTFPIFLCVW